MEGTNYHIWDAKREVIDTHFHIWDLQLRSTYPDPDASYGWPDSSLPPIYRNITAEEAGSAMTAAGVKNAVFVQCCNSCREEIDWVDKLARENNFIKGIVGGVDLTSKNIKSDLDSCSPLLVGVRHILDVEDPDWLLREDVHNGLAELESRGLAFDLLVRPPTLKHVPTIAGKFPNLRMVIDHISKPYLSQGTDVGLAGWKEDMALAASHNNVHCKISGLVTEVDPAHHRKGWTAKTFQPYMGHVLQVFGPDSPGTERKRQHFCDE